MSGRIERLQLPQPHLALRGAGLRPVQPDRVARAYPTGSPSRSTTTQRSGEAPSRVRSGSTSGTRSHPGRRSSIPGRRGTARA